MDDYGRRYYLLEQTVAAVVDVEIVAVVGLMIDVDVTYVMRP